ncbi:beta-phosphoglucomutase [Phaeodactylibacter luteus]|uniref:Beta-phosphoglucomutase n=1 Tax=Phaeodactylibacter luteus TaxID=1564516 RepID=A0A5C6RJT1_9BACT|nr:beta-phosphoglucomutase [Phaeodactylibacter luteus]TXB62205.1 beta-phosphoglucomutase [Phaeodactylibacter luteus]
MIQAFIFDLDGVIVDTAKYHFIAWRRMANSLGFDFTEAQNEQLKGVSRKESLGLILEWGGVAKSEAEQEALATQKNEWYREYILQMDESEILEGVVPFLDAAEAAGLKLGLGSSSKNATAILQQIGLASRFGTIIDGNKHTRSKPDPEVFQLGASALGVAPSECVVFEDAEKGVDAAIAGGFTAVGVGGENLSHAHMVIPGFQSLTPQDVLVRLSSRAAQNL